MEVQQQNSSNQLQEPPTTVSNEILLQTNGKELGKETSEDKGEESSVKVLKLDDPNPFVPKAVAESAEEKEVFVQRGNSESTNVLKDDKDGDEGAVKDEIPAGDMAAVERGGNELVNSGKVDGRECDAALTVRDNGLDVVDEQKDANSDVSLVIENDKDGGEGEMEAVEVEEDHGGEDVPVSTVAEIGKREELIPDVKNDGAVDIQKENFETLQGGDAITEGQDDVQGVDAEVVKEEGIVADEEEALSVEEGVKEEGNMADEDKAVGATENDEEELMVADEDKSLDTELETDDEATMADEEKVPYVEAMETELSESSTKGKGKRKRGRKSSKTTPKSTSTVVRSKMIDEDVCFICFDGGELVLCDKRNCPKAYHPSCVNRDAAFFQTKGKWNCGWHLCSICEKKAEYMCYTCTFSLCKACIKTNVLLCVRDKEKKGFCEACMKTIMLIDKSSHENQGNVDIDESSWEYLFKDYWTDLKAKLNLSIEDLIEAMNARKQETPVAQSDHKEDGGSGSENPNETLETKKSTRGRKPKKRKSNTKEDSSSIENSNWATRELLEFVMHMSNGDESSKTQFDVQALLLQYIKTNNLRDPRRKTHIICDTRLQRLFGKPRVGHFEMLKLLESHFLFKEDSQMDDIQGSVVDTEADDEEANENVAKFGKDRKRKIRKKGDREPQLNREDYAAINTHNIKVIYLRRKLVEDLLNDTETFHSKVVGTFVRIRISGANQKQDMYRLVQVTGTTKSAEYAVGKRTTNIMLEILNLDKKESVSIDTISNQDFTEDECKRLRQSIKCGLINRLTVGDILDKAMELQGARVNDWLEAEVLRLSHLRDRASDLGRKKELRECVEKLQVLKTPEERSRRLEDIPLIHADPTMDPNYESEDEAEEDDKKQDTYKSSVRPRSSKRQDYPSKASWSGPGSSRNPSKNYEFNRSLSNNRFSNKAEDATTTITTTSPHFESHNQKLRDQGRDTSVHQSSILKKSVKDDVIIAPTKDHSETASKVVDETEKMWHYKDPSGKIQGPFSMTQLRKWNNSKFFPIDLRIWKKSDKEENGVLLTNALEGRFTSFDHQGSTSAEIPKHGFANLPSPTPNRGVSGFGQMGQHAGPSLYHSSNEGLQSPTPAPAPAPAPTPTPTPTLLPNVVGSFGASTFTVRDSHSNNMPPQMVQQSVSGHGQSQSQSLPVGAYGWSGGPPLPSPLSNVAPPQPLVYNQWPPQANVSMNWGLSGQGAQLTGNVNQPWARPGCVPTPAGQGFTPSQGLIRSGNWVGPPGNHVEVASSGDMGWGPPNNNRSGFSGQKRNANNNRGGSGYTRQWDNNRGRSFEN